MKLGEKIRIMRKERGMTQARLAGERITPNMLCEIEKGKASPSLDTLFYLAEELDVPASYLLDENEDPAGFYRRRAMPEIKRLFLSGRYGECFRLCESLPGAPSEEVALLAAHAAYGEGKRAFHSGNLETALVYFSEALALAERTYFPTDSLRASASLYTALCSNVGAPRRDFDEKTYRTMVAEATESELYAYMTDNPDYPYENDMYAAHQKAHRLLRDRRRDEALVILKGLEDRKGESGVSAYFLFRLYTDMEICYREDRDFEKAYKYASKRMNLLSAFQS